MQKAEHAGFPLRDLVVTGILAALSVALVSMIHFPIFPAAPYLEYDPADIPIIIGSVVLGPLGGLILTIVVSVIQGLTVSATSGFYGILMHILATGVLTLITGGICRRKKTVPRLLLGLVCGVSAAVVTMLGANLVITPLFLGIPASSVVPMLLPIILPFNLIKLGANAAIALTVYKSISLAVGKIQSPRN